MSRGLQDDMLTVEEVVALFDRNDLTRDKRSIQRYASTEKFVDAFRDPDENRWYIPKDSALRFIERVKEINARHKAAGRVVPKKDSAQERAEVAELRNENQELKNKVRHLEVDVLVKEKLVDHVGARNAQLHRDSLVIAEAKGRLESENSFLKQQLQQLAAPPQEQSGVRGQSAENTQASFGNRQNKVDNGTTASVGTELDAGRASRQDSNFSDPDSEVHTRVE